MQVGKRLTVSRLLGESLKIVACLFSHQWHSARTGVNDRLGFKSRMKRVGCIGKKTLSRTVFELFAHLLGTGFKGHVLEFGTAVANGQLRLIFLHQSFSPRSADRLNAFGQKTALDVLRTDLKFRALRISRMIIILKFRAIKLL